MFRAYNGDIRKRRSLVGQSYRVDRFASDDSGTVAYEFNRYGYRGPDFDPEAKARAFLFGCSHTFGAGVDFDSIWAVRLARRLAEDEGIDESDLSLMNFAEIGASNDQIARSILQQCSAVKPTAVLALFTNPSRTEGFDANHTFRVGTWQTDRKLLRKTLRQNPEDSNLAATLHDRARMAESFLDFASPSWLQMNLAKNILLVQAFCREREIPCFLGIPADSIPPQAQLAIGDDLGDVVALIDRRRTLWKTLASFGDRNQPSDLAPDGMHYSAPVHHRFCEAFHAAIQVSNQAAEGANPS